MHIDHHAIVCSDAEIDATIQQRATDAVQVLFNDLFRLPVERAINGAVVTLPKIVTRYPREKPVRFVSVLSGTFLCACVCVLSVTGATVAATKARD